MMSYSATPTQKQNRLQNETASTTLTPSEIQALRQDLKDAYEYGKGFFAHRAKKVALLAK